MQVLGRADQLLWHWRECQGCQIDLKESWPREEPSNPKVGQGWYDERTDCLYVWDGMEWICAPED
jgi:hypothetical protein